MTSNGARGAEFERQTRDLLREHGYLVTRSTASKGLIDLFAVAPPGEGHFPVAPTAFYAGPHTLCVQAKRDGRLDHGEWNALYALAKAGGLVPVLAKREKVGRRHVVALYRLTGPRVPRSRTWPMERIETGGEA